MTVTLRVCLLQFILQSKMSFYELKERDSWTVDVSPI